MSRISQTLGCSIWDSAWTLLLAMTVARIAYGVQFQGVGAVGPMMVEDLGLAYATLGTLVGAYSMLGIPLALPAGWLSARLGDRRIVLTGLGLMICGSLLVGMASGFYIALGGRLISGAGGVLLLVSLPTIVMSHFSGAQLSAAMGILLGGYPAGIALASIALPLIGSWRFGMIATATLAALAFAIIAPVLKDGRKKLDYTGDHLLLGFRGLAPVIAAGIVWGSLNAGFAGLLGFAPTFFVEQGYSLAAAGSLVSIVALITVPIGPFGGWLIGALPRPLLGIATGVSIASAAIAVVAQGGIGPAIVLVTYGVAVGAIAGPIVALPAAVLAPEQRAIGMGVFWLTFFILMTVLPPIAGFARDQTHAAAAPLYAAAGFSAVGLAFLGAYAGLRRPLFGHGALL
jgi:predicted MFS family arabinose efflux permease